MRTGLLWFDDDPRKTLDVKIEQAAARFHEKYGCAPDVCYVSPSSAATNVRRGSLRVVPARTVRPNYLWIGMDDATS